MGNREASQAILLQCSAHGILLSKPTGETLCPEPSFPQGWLWPPNVFVSMGREARGLLRASATGSM